jgi:hypothetical protein
MLCNHTSLTSDIHSILSQAVFQICRSRKARRPARAAEGGSKTAFGGLHVVDSVEGPINGNHSRASCIINHDKLEKASNCRALNGMGCRDGPYLDAYSTGLAVVILAETNPWSL